MNHSLAGNTTDPPEGGDEHIRHILEELSLGYGRSLGFVPLDLCKKLSFELDGRIGAGDFDEAAIGVGQKRQVNRRVRNDKLCWWDHQLLSPVQKEYLDLLEWLRLAIAKHFRAPLTELEIFFAQYPAGGFYKKHYDNFEGRSSRRLVTTVLYLNEEWSPGDGGELKIWPNPVHGSRQSKEPALIQPEFGTLAFFITPETAHEVLPTKRERKSIVCWMGSRLSL